MKTTTALFAIVSVFFFSACSSTLKIAEIQNLVRNDFDSLRLQPAIEPNELRVDILRHTYEEQVTDSTKETKETAYHPLGFDLGNGLFYDLNNNLSLRIDYLFPALDKSDFEIEKITRPWNNKGIIKYVLHNDSLKFSLPPKKRIYPIYHRTQLGDSLSFLHNNKFSFAIVKKDSSMVYRIKKRVLSTIHRLDKDSYYLNKQKKIKFQKVADTIYIGNTYSITKRSDGKAIEIKWRRRKSDVTLFTIEKSDSVVFIYNKKYNGLKLHYQDSVLSVYYDAYLAAKYRLLTK